MKVAAYLALFLMLAIPSGALAGCPFVKGDDRQEVKSSMIAGALDASPVILAVADMLAAPNFIDHAAKSHLTSSADRWDGVIALAGGAGGQRTLREGDRVAMTAYLYAAKCQGDGDYHLEVGATQTFTGQCLIVEIPNPSRVSDGQLRARVTSAMNQIDALGGQGLENASDAARHILIMGQLFLDARHMPASGIGGGTRGTMTDRRKGHYAYCSTNILEIHPVTDIAVGVP